MLSAATVKPEDARHVEVGLKTEPLRGLTANFTAYNTEIEDFQTQVVNASVGVLRGYLANAEKVRVRGVEFDGNARVNRRLSLLWRRSPTPTASYVSFPDAPPPLEDTGGPQAKDISGSVLPGISKWALSFGGEYAQMRRRCSAGRGILRRRRHQLPHRISRRAPPLRGISSSTATRCSTCAPGFRAADGWTVFVWSRNLLDKTTSSC